MIEIKAEALAKWEKEIMKEEWMNAWTQRKKPKQEIVLNSATSKARYNSDWKSHCHVYRAKQRNNYRDKHLIEDP